MRTPAVLALVAIVSSVLAVDPSKVQLRVSLFPWIPDANQDGFARMRSLIIEEFSEKRKDVELIVDLSPSTCLDVYNPDDLSAKLSNASKECQFDLVEVSQRPRSRTIVHNAGSWIHSFMQVDTIILKELVEKGAVRPWQVTPSEDNFLPFSTAASKIGTCAEIVTGGSITPCTATTYGIPHWVCSNFVFSRSEEVASASSDTDLVAALKALDASTRDLSTDAHGSWTLMSFYLDAWIDTYPERTVQDALSTLPTLDNDVLAGLGSVLSLCNSHDGNPCVDTDLQVPRPPLDFTVELADSSE